MHTTQDCGLTRHGQPVEVNPEGFLDHFSKAQIVGAFHGPWSGSATDGVEDMKKHVLVEMALAQLKGMRCAAAITGLMRQRFDAQRLAMRVIPPARCRTRLCGSSSRPHLRTTLCTDRAGCCSRSSMPSCGLQTRRYLFTTWRWGRVAASLMLVGLVLRARRQTTNRLIRRIGVGN